MNAHTQPLNERLSALVDGELPAAELDALLNDMAQNGAMANEWHLYHLAGDVLRSANLAPQPSELEFFERFEKRLASEVPFKDVRGSDTVSAPDFSVSRRGSANGPWRWAAGAVFTGIVGVVSWGMWSQLGSGASSEWAQAPTVDAPLVNAHGPAVMLRDPELDALMAAHQQLGGHSAWQMPSGFLRNATYERPLR